MMAGLAYAPGVTAAHAAAATAPAAPAPLTPATPTPKAHGGGARSTIDMQAARAAAQEFEAVFISQILEQIGDGVDSDGPFGGGHGERVFRSMLNQEYGRAIAAQQGIGIADKVLAHMLAVQEGAR